MVKYFDILNVVIMKYISGRGSGYDSNCQWYD